MTYRHFAGGVDESIVNSDGEYQKAWVGVFGDVSNALLSNR